MKNNVTHDKFWNLFGMKYLDPDYEVDSPPTGLIPHFFDTINVLGGWKGLLGISFGVLLFFLVIDFSISYNRKRREQQKQKMMQKKK